MVLIEEVVGDVIVPDDSAKESSHFHLHGSHFKESLSLVLLSPCIGRSCFHVAAALA